MAFKLKKADITTLLGHARTLHARQEALEEAVNDYNDALRAAKDFVDAQAEEFRAEFDDKSETWQAGERAEAVNEFVERWEAVSQEHDEIDLPDLNLADTLEELDHAVGD